MKYFLISFLFIPFICLGQVNKVSIRANLINDSIYISITNNSITDLFFQDFSKYNIIIPSLRKLETGEYVQSVAIRSFRDLNNSILIKKNSEEIRCYAYSLSDYFSIFENGDYQLSVTYNGLISNSPFSTINNLDLKKNMYKIESNSITYKIQK